MTQLPDKLFFRIDETAEILRVSTRTIRRMIADDRMPAVKIRGSYRIKRTTLIVLSGINSDNSGQR